MDFVVDSASLFSASLDAQMLLRDVTLLSPSEPCGLLFGQDLLIAGPRIQAIGPTGSLTPRPDLPLTSKDCHGLLLLPGLINAHTHSPENVLKATSPSLPLELWLVPLFAGLEEWTPRLVYLSALLG